MNDLKDRGFQDPTEPTLPESNMSALLEEAVFHKKVDLKYSYHKIGKVLTITIRKHYRNRVDEVEQTFKGSPEMLEHLLWISQGLAKLNKREV